MFNEVSCSVFIWRSVRLCALLFGLVTLAMPVAASSVVDIHRAKIEVSDQSQSTLVRAGRKALAEVLVKMTGQQDVVDHPALAGLLRNPTQSLRSYQFEMHDDGLYLVTDFDPKPLQEVLRREGIPIWGERRPDGLLWLALDEQGERIILDEGASNPVREVLQDNAGQRGVPLSLPLMDLTDSQAITVYDVWGQFASTLRQASARYNVDYVLGARIYANDGHTAPAFEQTIEQQQAPQTGSAEQDALLQELADEQKQRQAFTPDEFRQLSAQADQGDYALDWVLIGGDEIQFGTLYGDDPQQVSAILVNDYADYLASLFAIIPNNQPASENLISISVANLESLAHYVHAQRYLSSLNVVDHAVLEKQSGSVATFTVGLVGNIDDLYNSLSLDSRLQPVRDAFGQPVEGLHFYWNE